MEIERGQSHPGGVTPDQHHTKYTDAEAISAVEGEATLDLSGVTTFGGDANFFLAIPDAGIPRITFDSDDFLRYSRADNTWELVIGASAVFLFRAASGSITNPLKIGAQTAPDASASLELSDNQKLLLLNRATTANLPTGVNGLLGYDSTVERVKGFINSGYQELLDASGGQTIGGTLAVTGNITLGGSATGITGAELETLSDTSDADALHAHSNHGVTHNATHTILDGGTAHSDAASDGVTRGSLIIGNSTPAWDELVAGAAATLLQIDAADGDPAWVAMSGDATIAAGGAVTVAGTHSGTAHHTKYTDAEAITAVEGEATLDLAGHVAIGASADVDTKAGSVLVLSETSTATDTRAGASGNINQLNITHTYTPASKSSSAFSGLSMDVIAGGDEDVDGVFLSGATSLQFVTQHDSEGDINQLIGAAGQAIMGNNPLDSVSAKTPQFDVVFAQGVGVNAAFIYSANDGYAGSSFNVFKGTLPLGVKALRASLVMRSFHDSGRTVTLNGESSGLELSMDTGNQVSTNRITITDLVGLRMLHVDSGSSAIITLGKMIKIGAWDSDPTYTNKYGITQEGTGDPNVFLGGGYFGGASVPTEANSKLAVLTADQDSTTGAIPAMTLDQADVDEDYFKFIGTSDTSADRALVDAANFTTPGAIVGWLKINVRDDQATAPIVDGDYYIPFYAVPTA